MPFGLIETRPHGEVEPTESVELKVLAALKMFVVVVENAVVNAPVELLYESGNVAERDDEEILFVKSVKSAADT